MTVAPPPVAPAVPEIRHSALTRAVARTAALQRAADLIGQDAVARGMGVAGRTLRAYLAAERGLPAIALLGAAAALERRASEFLAHAEALRGLARP